MALIDRVKARTGTDMADDELEAMIAGISAEIERRYGPAGEIEETVGDPLDDFRWRKSLLLARPLDTGSPVTIVELDPGDTVHPDQEVTLTEADYRVLNGGRTLQRLTGGPNGQSFWAPFVRLTYTPVGEGAARDELVIKVMALDLSYRGGLKSERAGDYQFTLGNDVADEREKLLASLAGNKGMNLA
ncbi:hypothetical protein [Devosia sp.]|uniref:hypothetical protein n=1 Tax=Devosia sp. TaxID=1871048 RepID=UPI001AC47C1C|nr:hypothetical protein [Devosia sp.]MBN9333866.1 hypothetical protein [Devosia sp.]